MYLFWKLYFNFFRFHFIIIIVFLLLFFLLFNIWFPHEAFCMDPFEDITSEENITSDEENMSDEDLRSRLWIARREEYFSYDGINTENTRLAKFRSLYPHGLPIDSSLISMINDSYDGEKYFDIPLTMICGESKDIDLSPGVYSGCIARNIDGLLIWPERLSFQVEFIKDYTQVLAKDNNISSVSLGAKFIDRFVFVYIKCQDINKHKYHWTIWERTHITKYWSYKAFKKRWDSETNVWSNLDDNIRKDIIIEVKDLLDIKRVDESVRKSVRSEVEKLIDKTRPFSTMPF